MKEIHVIAYLLKLSYLSVRSDNSKKKVCVCSCKTNCFANSFLLTRGWNNHLERIASIDDNDVDFCRKLRITQNVRAQVNWCILNIWKHPEKGNTKVDARSREGKTIQTQLCSLCLRRSIFSALDVNFRFSSVSPCF